MRRPGKVFYFVIALCLATCFVNVALGIIFFIIILQIHFITKLW